MYSKGYTRHTAPLGSDSCGLISAKLIDLPCAAVLSLITVSHDTRVVCVLLFAWAYRRINSLSTELLFAPRSPRNLQLDEKKKKIIKPSSISFFLSVSFTCFIVFSPVAT